MRWHILIKTCIFNKEFNRTDCGECYRCDLSSNKKCNNCGQCLKLEGYDIKAIEIDDIYENQKDLMDYEELDDLHNDSNELISEHDELWEYIDDNIELKGLEISEDETTLFEQFPGLLVYKKIK